MDAWGPRPGRWELDRRRRAVVLVDGEHHPPAVRAALDALGASGTEVALAVVIGGSEKVARAGVAPELGVPVVWPDDPARRLRGLVRETGADVVVDRSGHPALTEIQRLRFVAGALAAGAAYEAPGVLYTPPPPPARTRHPAISVVATGKRTGKTALSGALTRHAQGRGWQPAIVAMGRGGPAEPVVLEPHRRLDVDALLQMAEDGEHAASDYVEDAVFTGAYTVGCRRVGDGPSGETGPSNVTDGVAVVDGLPVDLVILEGSGAAVPPCAADASLLVVPATVDRAELAASVPLRFIEADAVVVTHAGPPTAAADVAATVASVRELVALRGDGPAPPIALVSLRPHPTGDIRGRRVYLTTTASAGALGTMVAHLTGTHGAEVVGASPHLSDRRRLAADLDAAPPYDVLVTELKAAGVDIVVRAARAAAVEVVFCDNRPAAVPLPDGLEAGGRLVPVQEVFDHLLDLAGLRRGAHPAGDLGTEIS